MRAAEVAKEILFVGDDDALREVLAESLREAVSVSAVTVAADALEMLSRRTPDLILLDLGMSVGEMSGMELLARLRENVAWALIPVVVFSAIGDVINPDVTSRLGVRAVLTKSTHHRADVAVTIKRILESG